MHSDFRIFAVGVDKARCEEMDARAQLSPLQRLQAVLVPVAVHGRIVSPQREPRVQNRQPLAVRSYYCSACKTLMAEVCGV